MKKILSSVMTLAVSVTVLGLFSTEASAGKYVTLSTVFEENYDGETVATNTTGTGEVVTDAETRVGRMSSSHTIFLRFQAEK